MNQLTKFIKIQNKNRKKIIKNNKIFQIKIIEYIKIK